MVYFDSPYRGTQKPFLLKYPPVGSLAYKRIYPYSSPIGENLDFTYGANCGEYRNHYGSWRSR